MLKLEQALTASLSAAVPFKVVLSRVAINFCMVSMGYLPLSYKFNISAVELSCAEISSLLIVSSPSIIPMKAEVSFSSVIFITFIS